MSTAKRPVHRGITDYYPEFERMLIERRDDIMGRRETARAQLDEQIMTSPGDDADASVIDTSADYFLKLTDHHQRELVDIRDALVRIQRGTYGLCPSCGNEISLERLRKLPYARFCIDCQSSLEARDRTRRLHPIPKL